MKLSEHIKISKQAIKLMFHLDKTYAVCVFSDAILSSLIPYIPIYFSALLIDALIAKETVNTIITYVLLTIGLTFLASLLHQWIISLNNRARSAAYRSADWMYSEKAMQMAYESIEHRETKLLLERIKKETQTGFNLFYLFQSTKNISSSITKVIASVGMTVSFFTLDAISSNMKLALVVGIILTVAYSILATSKSSAIDAAFYDGCVDMNILSEKYREYITDYSAGKDIRLYDMVDLIANESAENDRQFYIGTFWTNVKKALLSIPQAALYDVLKYGTYLILVFAALQGSISVGSIAKYVTCLMMLITAISSLVLGCQMSFANNYYLKRFFSYFDIPNNMYQGSLTVEKRNDNEYYVDFRDVSFKYPSSDSYVLHHVNIKFKIGEKLAIVGMNGSGKTTFIKLMCRLYDPTEGQILLNGVDISKYDYDEYMSIFSIVFQDFRLIAMTLGQNVATAKNYNEEKVRNALLKLGLAID